MGTRLSADACYPLGSFEAQLPARLESAVAARQLLAVAVSAWALSETVRNDGTLTVSELVTNAVLHAGTPIGLTILRAGSGVRIEVRDGDSRLPMVDAARPEGLLNNRSMTGRGLPLVAATADRWGSDPADGGGKVTWAEVGTGQRAAPAAPAPARATAFPPARTLRPASRAAATPAGRRVRLIGVPVELILESTQHLADLQREIQVMAMGRTKAPPEVERVVQAGQPWVSDIDLWTDSDRRLAEAALRRGEETVDFEVTVPEDVAKRIDGVGRWLRRTASSVIRRHLLTLPASNEVMAYRRWYRDEILAQLSGRPPQPCPIRARGLTV